MPSKENGNETPKGNPPVKVIRMGAVKCNIWKKELEKKETGEKFTVYNADIARTYRDEADQPKDTNSMRQNDMLVASLVLQRAYVWIANAVAQDRASSKLDEDV